MSAGSGRILVVLEEGTTAARAFGRRGRPPHPFVVRRWNQLARSDFSRQRVNAVLYEAAPDRRLMSGRVKCLRRLAPGVPLFPFRPHRARESRPEPSRALADQSSETLTGPLDQRCVQVLLQRERRIERLLHQRDQVESRRKEQEAKLKALSAVVRATGNELEPHRIVELAMSQVSPFLKLRDWLFLRFDPDEAVLVVEQTAGEGMTGFKGAQIGMGEGLTGRAAQRRHAVLDVEGGGAAAIVRRSDLPKGLTPRSALAVPLVSRDRVIGVIVAVDRSTAQRFNGDDAQMMSFLLEPAAVALDSALLLRKSEALSVTDDLTKLYNSRFLNATLRREVERGRRYGVPVSLIFLDLDGFKHVNDRHGHLSGSRTLAEVGSVIRDTVREVDVVSRYGGDEFTVILPQTGPEGAYIIADRVRQRIADTVFLQAHGLEVQITASVGIACFPEHGRNKDDLIAWADRAMYSVKGRGKNGVALAEIDDLEEGLVRLVG